MDWSVVIGTILGGLLSFAGGFVSNVYANRKEHAIWLRNQRVNLFCELIAELESINIPVICSPETESKTKIMNIDTNEIELRLNLLSNYITENAGRLILFLPDGLYSELMKLQAELYSALSEEAVDFAQIEDCVSRLVSKPRIFAGIFRCCSNRYSFRSWLRALHDW